MRESERETITEPPEHHVDLQLKGIVLQIKEALDADEQCRLLYKIQGVVLDFIDEKKCQNVINHTLFDQGNFLAPGENQITVSALNSI